MREQMVFQKAILAGIIFGSIGLSACSTVDEGVVQEEWDVSEPALAEENWPEELDIICEDEKSCTPTDNYLTNQFVQTQTSDHEEIALSKPAGVQATSVKEKQKQKAEALADDETIWYTTTAIPETGAGVASTKQGTATAGAVVAGAAATTGAVTKSQKEKKQTKATEGQTFETVTETETSVRVAPGEMAASRPVVIDATGAGMVPLKKVKTTITETTTMIDEDEQSKDQDFSGMTLMDKIGYGEKVHDWDANSGRTVRELLMEWGEKSGWTVVWKLDRDYHLEAGVVFRGVFTDVASALIRSFARATPAPIGTFYQGNRVLVISTQEDENER